MKAPIEGNKEEGLKILHGMKKSELPDADFGYFRGVTYALYGDKESYIRVLRKAVE